MVFSGHDPLHLWRSMLNYSCYCIKYLWTWLRPLILSWGILGKLGSSPEFVEMSKWLHHNLRARTNFNEWLSEPILKQGDIPASMLYSIHDCDIGIYVHLRQFSNPNHSRFLAKKLCGWCDSHTERHAVDNGYFLQCMWTSYQHK